MEIEEVSDELMKIRDRVVDEIHTAPNVTDARVMNGLIEAYQLGIKRMNENLQKGIAEARKAIDSARAML